jgi:hypothetical protein
MVKTHYLRLRFLRERSLRERERSLRERSLRERSLRERLFLDLERRRPPVAGAAGAAALAGFLGPPKSPDRNPVEAGAFVAGGAGALIYLCFI